MPQNQTHTLHQLAVLLFEDLKGARIIDRADKIDFDKASEISLQIND